MTVIEACVVSFDSSDKIRLDECIVSAIVGAILQHNMCFKQKINAVEENVWRPFNNMQVWSKWLSIK